MGEPTIIIQGEYFTKSEEIGTKSKLQDGNDLTEPMSLAALNWQKINEI